MDTQSTSVLAKDYPLIEKALREGYRLRGFHTGGGLREFELTGLGEAISIPKPTSDDALQAIERWLARDGRTVVGPHYITGANATSSRLDEYVSSGRGNIDIWFDTHQKMFASRVESCDWDMHDLSLTRHAATMSGAIAKVLRGYHVILATEH